MEDNRRKKEQQQEFIVETPIYIEEILGKGTLFAGSPVEIKIIGNNATYLIDTTTSTMFGWYANNNLMVLPAAALFIIGILIWIHRTINPKLVDIS